MSADGYTPIHARRGSGEFTDRECGRNSSRRTAPVAFDIGATRTGAGDQPSGIPFQLGAGLAEHDPSDLFDELGGNGSSHVDNVTIGI
jgi:hypothetical protein